VRGSRESDYSRIRGGIAIMTSPGESRRISRAVVVPHRATGEWVVFSKATVKGMRDIWKKEDEISS
jgi:hypothetical protein